MNWANMCISEDDFTGLSVGDMVHLKKFSEAIDGYEDVSDEAIEFFDTDVVIKRIDTDVDDCFRWCFSVYGYDNMCFLPNDIEYIVEQEVLSITFEPAADLNDLFNEE